LKKDKTIDVLMIIFHHLKLLNNEQDLI